MSSDPSKPPNRFDVERATEWSPLPTPCRDVLYALARQMIKDTTVIPLHVQPSLKTLAKKTGWSKRHVQRALDYLEVLNIIERRRPPMELARTEHARTTYVVIYDRLFELGTGSPKAARDAQALGLGPVRRKPRAKVATELGTARPEPRDSVAPVQISSDPPTDQTDSEVALIAGVISSRTGYLVSDELARQIRAVILARPGAQGQRPLTYIRRVLANEPRPERWLRPQDSPGGTT
jgi:hypothetical protein